MENVRTSKMWILLQIDGFVVRGGSQPLAKTVSRFVKNGQKGHKG